MAFPINPTTGITHDINGRVWSFNGYAWDRVLGSSGSGSVSLTLDDLTDVIITGVCGNDVLYYDSTANSWINKSVNTLTIDGGLY
jgi:hypothetical protein